VREFCVIDQAREACGGARVDWDAKRSVAGVLAGDSAMRRATKCAPADPNDVCGCAHWEVVTARQQSWLQQAVLRTERWSASEPWHWWGALRRQQAWGGAAVAANASGTKVPASANNSRNLAVQRCMVVV